MKFININSGDIFETEEAARQDMLDHMIHADYASYIEPRLSYEELLRWAFQHNFFEENEDLIYEAEEEFFNDWYEEYADEEEEEDF